MPKYLTLATLVALPLGFAAVALSAQELSKEELASRLNGIEAKDITDAPIPGMYQVAIGANVAYVTKLVRTTNVISGPTHQLSLRSVCPRPSITGNLTTVPLFAIEFSPGHQRDDGSPRPTAFSPWRGSDASEGFSS